MEVRSKMKQVIRLYAMMLVLATFLTAELRSQWDIELDSTYGNNGLSVDPSVKPLDAIQIPELVYILSDGSGLVVRTATNLDTSVIVSRILSDGYADPEYDVDGLMAMGAWQHPDEYALSPDELLWYGRRSGNMYVLSEIDRNGQVRPSPIWQDTAEYTVRRLIGVRQDRTLAVMSQKKQDDTYTWFYRYIVPGYPNPKSDIFVQFDPLWQGIFAKDLFLDQSGRLIESGRSTDSTFIIARYSESGPLDTTFGNQKGVLNLEMPDDDFPRIWNYRALRNGGYVVVLRMFDQVDKNIIRILKIDDNGTPNPSFGNNGFIDFRGRGMEPRGIVECPNGDLLLATYAPDRKSFLFQIRPDGTQIPPPNGATEKVNLVRILSLQDNGMLYALSADPYNGYKYVLSRFRVSSVTSVGEMANRTPLDISIDHDVITVKGAGTTATVRVYSLVGQCVFEQQCDAYGSVTLPSVMSGTYVVSASTEQDVKSTVVNIVR